MRIDDIARFPGSDEIDLALLATGIALGIERQPAVLTLGRRSCRGRLDRKADRPISPPHLDHYA